MPASPARIGFIMSEYRRVVATSSTPSARFGNLARESDDPVPTLLDSVSDAQTVATARQALMSPERRVIDLTLTSPDELLALPYVGAVPVGDYVDSERGLAFPVLVASFSIDLDGQSCSVGIWG